jgi:serine/threonine-protein kinase HipA
VAPSVRAAMNEHPAFIDIGKRMLKAWQEGVDGLHDKRVYALGVSLGEAFNGFSDPPKP